MPRYSLLSGRILNSLEYIVRVDNVSSTSNVGWSYCDRSY